MTVRRFRDADVATLWALNAYPYAGLSLYARRRR